MRGLEEGDKLMSNVEKILNLEPTPNVMPSNNGWLAEAKVRLQEHFDQRTASFPVYDRAVSIRA
jgi:hypothetical protein